MAISQTVTLDISTGAATVGRMIFMQRESEGRQLEFTVLNAGSAYTLTGFTEKIIVIEKPDGEIIYNNLTDVNQNTAKYTFTSQSQIVKGLLRCWLKFKSGGQIVVTPEFHIRVNEVADFDAAVESTSEFGVLDSLIKVASDAVDEMNDMTASFENATASATTLAEGESATVSLIDGEAGKEFAFGIPKGEKGDKGDTGDAATIAVGTVTTLDAGESVTIENSGTSAAAVFDFGIPKGDTGEVSATDLATAISGHNTSDTAHPIPFINLITNGDFSAGTTGWTGGAANISVADKIMSVECSGVSQTGNVSSEANISSSTSDRIYMRCSVRATNSVCSQLRMNFYAGTTSHFINIKSNPLEDVWYPVSGIVTVTSGTTTTGKIYVYHTYANPATAAGKVMEIDGNYGITVINLTTIETLTGIAPSKAAVDKICATWWNGTKQVSLFDFLIAEIIALRG